MSLMCLCVTAIFCCECVSASSSCSLILVLLLLVFCDSKCCCVCTLHVFVRVCHSLFLCVHICCCIWMCLCAFMRVCLFLCVCLSMCVYVCARVFLWMFWHTRTAGGYGARRGTITKSAQSQSLVLLFFFSQKNKLSNVCDAMYVCMYVVCMYGWMDARRYICVHGCMFV